MRDRRRALSPLPAPPAWRRPGRIPEARSVGRATAPDGGRARPVRGARSLRRARHPIPGTRRGCRCPMNRMRRRRRPRGRRGLRPRGRSRHRLRTRPEEHARRHGLAGLCAMTAHDTGDGGGDVHHRFRRFQGDHRLIEGNRLALRDVPLHDIRVGETFAEIREPKDRNRHGTYRKPTRAPRRAGLPEISRTVRPGARMTRDELARRSRSRAGWIGAASSDGMPRNLTPSDRIRDRSANSCAINPHKINGFSLSVRPGKAARGGLGYAITP